MNTQFPLTTEKAFRIFIRVVARCSVVWRWRKNRISRGWPAAAWMDELILCYHSWWYNICPVSAGCRLHKRFGHFRRPPVRTLLVMNNWKEKLLSLFLNRSWALHNRWRSGANISILRRIHVVFPINGKHFRVDISINLFSLFFVPFSPASLKVLRRLHDMGRLDVNDLHDSLHSAGVPRQLDIR